jgi:phage terminase small subunit
MSAHQKQPRHSRHLLLQYKGTTLDELKELASIHSKAGHRMQQTIRDRRITHDPDAGNPTGDFSEHYAPATLGLIRKEIYYRERFGGTTVSEKYPELFTVKGPKSPQAIKKQDKKLLKQYDKYLETKDLDGPKFYQNGSYKDITRVTLSNGLTMREEKFCLNYIATADPIEAWIKSGYDHSYPNYDVHARMWVRQPKIQERINELMEEAKEKMRWNADTVLDRFDEIYKSSMAEQDHTNASRSMEQIAKHLGMFIDRSESRVGNLDSMKSEDIDTDISKLADVVGLKVVNGGKD